MGRNEYEGIDFSHSPELMCVSSGKEALFLVKEGRFDLILTTLHIDDMEAILAQILETPLMIRELKNLN